MKIADPKKFLPWFMASSAFNGMFAVLTFGSSVFILFLDQLGLDKGQIGAIMSLFPFCGILALFIASGVARFGVRRTYLIFFGLRKLVMLAVLLTPWVLRRGGGEWAFYYVAGLMAVFALCRATAETAYYPWVQEIVPPYTRGKFDAMVSLVTTIVLMGTMLVAGKVIGGGTGAGLSRYMILIGVGVGLGLLSVYCASWIPGGRPVPAAAGAPPHFKGFGATLRDSNFVRYLVGLSFVTLVVGGVLTFLPLYARQALGVNPGWVIRLDISSLLGGLLSIYLWGWAADRYGSKPVMVSALTLMVALPLGLVCAPRGASSAFTGILALTLLWGIGVAGMTVGTSRLLNVNLVPPHKRTHYMAVYYAVVGLAGGFGPLAGGWLLERLKGFSWSYGMVSIDAFGVLFATLLGLLGIGWILFRSLPTTGEMPVRQFAFQFIQGNPVLALGSMIGFSLARDEEGRAVYATRMGMSRSPLALRELEAALQDPSFMVRNEAATVLARTRADAGVLAALRILAGGPDPDLAVLAIQALGWQHDRGALPVLRAALVGSPHPQVRARCARTLALLDDRDVIVLVTTAFAQETDPVYRLAFGVALGRFQVRDQADALWAFLIGLEDPQMRREAALSLVRLWGERDDPFVRLCREEGERAPVAVLRLIQNWQKRPAPGIPISEWREWSQAVTDALNRGDWGWVAGGLEPIGRSVLSSDPVAIRLFLNGVEVIRTQGNSRPEIVYWAIHLVTLSLDQPALFQPNRI